MTTIGRFSVDPVSSRILANINTASAIYRVFNAGPNPISVDGNPVSVGESVDVDSSAAVLVTGGPATGTYEFVGLK